MLTIGGIPGLASGAGFGGSALAEAGVAFGAARAGGAACATAHAALRAGRTTADVGGAAGEAGPAAAGFSDPEAMAAGAVPVGSVRPGTSAGSGRLLGRRLGAGVPGRRLLQSGGVQIERLRWQAERGSRLFGDLASPPRPARSRLRRLQASARRASRPRPAGPRPRRGRLRASPAPASPHEPARSAARRARARRRRAGLAGPSARYADARRGAALRSRTRNMAKAVPAGPPGQARMLADARMGKLHGETRAVPAALAGEPDGESLCRAGGRRAPPHWREAPPLWRVRVSRPRPRASKSRRARDRKANADPRKSNHRAARRRPFGRRASRAPSSRSRLMRISDSPRGRNYWMTRSAWSAPAVLIACRMAMMPVGLRPIWFRPRTRVRKFVPPTMAI